jgi:hypothetical protein
MDEEGKWRTVNGAHIEIGKGGEVEKGPPKLKAALNSKGKATTGAGSVELPSGKDVKFGETGTLYKDKDGKIYGSYKKPGSEYSSQKGFKTQKEAEQYITENEAKMKKPSKEYDRVMEAIKKHPDSYSGLSGLNPPSEKTVQKQLARGMSPKQIAEKWWNS